MTEETRTLEVITFGSSLGIIIHKDLRKLLKVKPGDRVKVKFMDVVKKEDLPK